jgi:hypothetical protein
MAKKKMRKKKRNSAAYFLAICVDFILDFRT